MCATLALGPAEAIGADEQPGKVTLEVRAAPRTGAKPGQGAPPARSEYGYAEDDDVGPYTGVNYKRLRGVVVWLEPVGEVVAGVDLSAGAQAPVTIGVGGRRPPAGDGPPVYGVGVGQRVQFRNGSDEPISVFSFGAGNEFRLRGVAPGARAEWIAAAAGEVEILTDKHDDPAAVVIVAPTRFVARADAGKSAEFDGAPAGAWRACAWHSRIPARPEALRVRPGARTKAVVTLSVDAIGEGDGAGAE